MGRNRLSNSVIPEDKVSVAAVVNRSTMGKLKLICVFLEIKQSEFVEKAINYYVKVKLKELKNQALAELESQNVS